MLSGDFFILNAINVSGNMASATLTLNATHRIFEGHFPGQPVVPGVCMMQMVKEVLEASIGIKTRLIKSDYAKFLSMIDPRVTKMINAELKYTTLENGEINVVSSLFKEDIIFLKYKAVFISQIV